LTRTFLDAGVLISATTGRDDLFDRAWDILDDPERVFLSSDFVRLEVLPKAHYFHHQDEVDFYEMFFTEVAQMVAPQLTVVMNTTVQRDIAALAKGARAALVVSNAEAARETPAVRGPSSDDP
jgi:hypothetical protein